MIIDTVDEAPFFLVCKVCPDRWVRYGAGVGYEDAGERSRSFAVCDSRGVSSVMKDD